MSCLTLTKALINHLQSWILHCNTSTMRETTCPPPQRTFLPVTTNDCYPYHLTKHPLTKRHLLTRKHSTKVDSTTLYSTNQLKQANQKTDNALQHPLVQLSFLAKTPVPKALSQRPQAQPKQHQDQLRPNEQHQTDNWQPKQTHPNCIYTDWWYHPYF